MAADPVSVLTRALEASVTGEIDDVGEVFTDDVVGWSPNLSISSRAELEAELVDRDDAMSNIVIEIDAADVVGAKVIAEWRIGADHTGPLVVDDDLVIEPTGRRIVLAGASFAELRDGRIAAFRHYFDDAALMEQLLLEV